MNIDDLFIGKPVLETPRLQLQKLELTDAGDFYEFASDPAITEHVRWGWHHSVEETAAFLQSLNARYDSRRSFNWGIRHKEAGKVIGRICLFGFDEDNDSAEIGYTVSRQYWGQGIITEAGREVAKYAFERLGVNRLEARCNEANTRSERVMQRLGMTFEGVLRQQLKFNSEYKSQKIYSILRSEFY